MTTLRIILGDQLTNNISSLEDIDLKRDIVLMCEVMDECTYVKHHKKKIAFVLSAMRHFAQGLIKQGYNVKYTKLDDQHNSGSIIGEIKRFTTKYKPKRIVITMPGEYRLLDALNKLNASLSIPIEIKDDNRFLATFEEFSEWANTKTSLRMEFFYRMMRVKHRILMNNDKPEGGKWNYDSDNRKFPKNNLDIPKPYQIKPDKITQEVLRLVSNKFSDHFGDLEPFYFAVTREEALNILDLFIKNNLKYFGDYQDAMIQGEPWMFHSRLSFYINIGLLSPIECIRRAEKAYYQKKVSINAAEGFIRQILGWREYIRGIYWLKMPQYKQHNFFNASRSLPDFFWTADTKMNCLKQCINETKQNSYAHHIQRLMVLGNFALLAGIHPDAINEWYLIVYADAYEWVELPNVTGMILFADGGYLASKPYAASGAYINKMSNYCENCVYKVEDKNGTTACPFNYLYWDFLIRHREKLKNNQRLRMIYASLDRMDKKRISLIQKDTQHFFDELS